MIKWILLIGLLIFGVVSSAKIALTNINPGILFGFVAEAKIISMYNYIIALLLVIAVAGVVFRKRIGWKCAYVVAFFGILNALMSIAFVTSSKLAIFSQEGLVSPGFYRVVMILVVALAMFEIYLLNSTWSFWRAQKASKNPIS